MNMYLLTLPMGPVVEGVDDLLVHAALQAALVFDPAGGGARL